MKASRATTPISPVLKAVTVPLSVDEAFALFTAAIASWWPIATHSVTESATSTVVFESGVGGTVYERAASGERAVWGTILVWEAPKRVVLTWHPGSDPSTAQEVEIRFEASGEDTVVELEHRGWEVLGEQGAGSREGYNNGWNAVLATFFAGEARRRAALR